MRALIFLVVLLLFPCFSLAQTWVVEPGASYGPIFLGQSLSEAQKILGTPSKSQPSSSDPSSQLLTYPGSVMLLVNRDRKVLGITTWAAQARTAQGLGIGSSQTQVQGALGRGLQRGQGQILYNDLGLGFSYDDQGRAKTLFLFKPEAQQALHGDRLILPGLRCGDLKIGMPLAQVVKAWGSAPEHSGQDYRWPERGVGLLVIRGKVEAITVTTGDFMSKDGLKVGCPSQDVARLLGAAEDVAPGAMLYPSKGVAFYFAGNQVASVQIFAPIK